ncbi:MAG: double-strand break repair protein AddB, partial [Pseudomonadota bacterium]
MINSNDDALDRNLSEEPAARWRGPFAETGPRVFTIDPGEPFLTRLASGLAASAPDPRNPLLITDVQLFLPTRRAARGLSEALLSVAADQDEPAAGAAFTPRIRALGDIEDTDLLELAALAGGAPPEAFPPPAMGEAARRFSAVGAVLAASEGEPPSDLAALALADEFNALQDSLYTEEVDINRLDTAAPAEHAAHWGEALKLAKAARKAVSDRAHRDGVMDPAARQAAMVDLLARIWARTPPTHPVVAAGSTGSAPAVARLLAAIARLPQGCVVLPGLDLDLNARGWARIDDPHPQNGLKKLLAAMDVDRSDVRPWPGPASAAPSSMKPSAARRRLWSAALRPAEATDDWRAIAADLAAADPGAAGAAQGLHRIVARDDGEEAGAIALLMRETLEQPRRTAMLVTPDRVLARRVCARLARWGVEADDSAGAPLSSTPLGAFLRLAAAAAIAPTPLSLLSLLTSKICDETGVCDLSPEETREGLRVLDLYAFRGPAGPPGLAGLRKKLTDWSAGDALTTEAARRGARLLGALESAFAPLAD